MLNELFKPKPTGPEYTIRMLLAKTTATAETKEKVPELKKFAHFTLGCTAEDKTSEVTLALEQLSDFFKDSISFKADAAVNLGSDEKPIWAVSLSLGKNEKDIRAVFSAQFDHIMCPEQNGILYQWQPKEGASKKCPHITVGNKEMANALVKQGCEFLFDRIDYKRVGPHDPHVSKLLEKTRENDLSF